MGFLDKLFKSKTTIEQVKKIDNQNKLIEIALDSNEDDEVRLEAISKINTTTGMNKILRSIGFSNEKIRNAAKQRYRTLCNRPREIKFSLPQNRERDSNTPTIYDTWSKEDIRRMREEFD